MRLSRSPAPNARQLPLPFSALRNSEFLANHWFEHRLPLEPEWQNVRPDLAKIASALLSLWTQQKSRVELYGIEASLEQAFIQPIFQILGWKLKYQTSLQGREPDYALFADDGALDSALGEGHTAPAFWRHATMVADAKAWHVSLDRPTRIGSQREYPPEQIEWYLDRSRLDFGILTNGRFWRLVPRELGAGKPRFKTYLEVDLPELLEKLAEQKQLTIDAEEFDDLRRFVLFFSPAGFSGRDVAQPLVVRAVHGSAEYAIGIGENLKERVFEALRICIEGLLSVPDNELSPTTDLHICKEQSLILLYRLLFIMFAEDRGLLPYRTNRVYTRNRSLARRRDEIAAILDGVHHRVQDDYSRGNFSLWEDLTDLFDLIDRGHGTYGVPAYDGGLFDPDKNKFLTNKKVPDWHIAKVVDLLGRALDPAHPKQGLFRVDYRDLAVQQLGGVYEGLLELTPNYATENMVIIRGRGTDVKSDLVRPSNASIPPGYELTSEYYPEGSVFLVTDKGERRSYGSYYTPDHIVSYIVENTLAPLCEEIFRGLSQEIEGAEAEYSGAASEQKPAIAEKLQALRTDFGERVLKLRILDPAMGSGHFLVRACQYLAEEIATNPNTGDIEPSGLASDESSLTYWKRRVVEACIFGVDLNPMAVELAKLALWLDTVSVGHPLSFLDLHLLSGNSLIGARLDELGSLPDAPPLDENLFGAEYRERLPAIIRTLVNIQQMPSDTTAQVKEKDRLLRRHFRPFLDAFRTVADLWCSHYFYSGKNQITPALYDVALQRLGNRSTLRSFIEAAELDDTVLGVHQPGFGCFHWELEFPDIFEPDRAERGFDAVIGNPPYDVLSEKELKRDLSKLRAYFASRSAYAPSRRGKNNLYKLFICRFVELMRDGGRLGVIVPMALLGDDISALVRRMLIEQGTFIRIDVFPQKDDPNKRVFRDAKLSTCIVHYSKTQDPTERSRSFISQIHPEDKVEPSSPRIALTAGHIPLYDPSNFTIVSCSQDDWDLATRIMSTGRLVRLRDYVEFSQGEVNETNQRQAGNLCSPNEGQLVVRGANICLYVARPASQGTDLFLNTPKFLTGASEDSKAFHFQYDRVAVQESSPQNNFRRIIAAIIPSNEFCNHTINYVPAHMARLPISFIAALLNSDLADWYFRLGSTNAHVSHYQLYNLPCPWFDLSPSPRTEDLIAGSQSLIRNNLVNDLQSYLVGLIDQAPFDIAIPFIIAAIVDQIIASERARGVISRSARSKLAPQSQNWQDLIDCTLTQMAGISEGEHNGLRARLDAML